MQGLNETAPNRARRAAECLRLAVSLLREVTVTVGVTVGVAVDWSAIEELYRPAENGFTDTPVTWPITGRAARWARLRAMGAAAAARPVLPLLL